MPDSLATVRLLQKVRGGLGTCRLHARKREAGARIRTADLLIANRPCGCPLRTAPRRRLGKTGLLVPCIPIGPQGTASLAVKMAVAPRGPARAHRASPAARPPRGERHDPGPDRSGHLRHGGRGGRTSAVRLDPLPFALDRGHRGGHVAIRLGIIGDGYWGPNLLRNFAECVGVTVRACAELQGRSPRAGAAALPCRRRHRRRRGGAHRSGDRRRRHRDARLLTLRVGEDGPGRTASTSSSRSR